MIRHDLTWKCMFARRMVIPLIVLTTAMVTTLILIIGFKLWFDRVYTEDTTFVRLAPQYRVVVPGTPVISGRLYSLSNKQEYLLVLASESPAVLEPYYLNLSAQEIGVPNLPQYMPLFNGALVNRDCDGFAIDTGVDADWIVEDKGERVRIRIKGLAEEAHRFHSERHPDESDRKFIPVGYHREIVLETGS